VKVDRHSSSQYAAVSQASADIRRDRIDLRLIATILAIAAAYVVFAKIGFALAFATRQVTAVWPPTGIAVAALLLFGFRVWPGVWLGAFIANALTQETMLTAALIAVGNTLGPLLGTYLLRRIADFDVALERVRDVVALVVFGSILAMTVTATNGVLNLVLAGIVSRADFASVWWLWWIGDSMGVLVVAPLILTWSIFKPIELKPARLVEHAAFGVVMITGGWLQFMSRLPLAFSPFPFIVWSALRFRQRATALAIVIISTIAVVGTIRGLGPFTAGDLDHRLIQLVMFMAILTVTGLVLGALTAERQLAGRQLKEAEKRFQIVAEIVPAMMWTANDSGSFEWVNRRWCEYTGQTEQDAMGMGWLQAYYPDDIRKLPREWPQWSAAGERFSMETRIRGADGTYRWFLVRAEPLLDVNGRVIRWYGTTTDIDDQTLALQQTTRVAEALQAAFLPDSLPVRSDLRFDALYLPAEREALVGGDWYDVFDLPDGSIVVSIGDVLGHGVPAAVMAGRVKHGIFTLALDGADPSTILVKVNRMIRERDSTVVTALVAIVDPDLRRMRYASAGHPPPVLASPSVTAGSLPVGGPPLGIGPLVLQDHIVPLEPHAVAVFYTDGITEFKRDIVAAEAALIEAAGRLVGDNTMANPAITVQRAVMGGGKSSDDSVLVVMQLAPGLSSVSADGTSMRRTWAFHSGDARLARVSRHELMDFIRGYSRPSEDLSNVELIVGELLANTVEHAPGLVSVDIDWSAREPILTLSDSGPGLARFVPKLPDDRLDENGRGLFLVEALAHDVRVDAGTDHGLKIRVTLPVSRET
jgi:PAS domain S-box-containing protein